jgi:Holliday junction DNA helicase RuvA
MIGRIVGRIIEKNPPRIIVDVHGLGYEVDVPMSTFYQLPELEQTVQLFTHFVVREDEHLLFGFSSALEQQTFRQLIKINGVGVRTALSMLSGLAVDELIIAIQQQDLTTLKRIPGIGQKTAERLVLELKGKFDHLACDPIAIATSAALSATGTANTSGTQTTSGVAAGLAIAPQIAIRREVEQALHALGYSEREASAALKKLPAEYTTSEGIRVCLRLLSSGG